MELTVWYRHIPLVTRTSHPETGPCFNTIALLCLNSLECNLRALLACSHIQLQLSAWAAVCCRRGAHTVPDCISLIKAVTEPSHPATSQSRLKTNPVATSAIFGDALCFCIQWIFRLWFWPPVCGQSGLWPAGLKTPFSHYTCMIEIGGLSQMEWAAKKWFVLMLGLGSTFDRKWK